MLSNKKISAFVPTAKPEQAKKFYSDILGLTLVSEDDFALEFSANGAKLRVTVVRDFKPQSFTVVGWEVEDIDSVIGLLDKNNVACEKYGFLKQDTSGIWTAPNGTKVAWFKDPDGNLLSLSETL